MKTFIQYARRNRQIARHASKATLRRMLELNLMEYFGGVDSPW